MLFFKACRKCITGTVELRDGLDGPEFTCLNCSASLPPDTADQREMTFAA